jgi:adenosylhomocysteine nucleosidase
VKIGLIAAEAFELMPLVRRLNNPQNVGLPIRFGRMGRWKEAEWICAADGSGPKVAGHVTRQLVEKFRPDVLWSVGLCGGLENWLRFADVVRASEVVDVASGTRFRCDGMAGLGDGVAVSQERVALTVQEKRELSTLGSVVEMEAAGVAREAAMAGLPFGCVKVISDTADEPISIDLNAARDSEGRIEGHRVVRQAMKHPLSGTAELFRLWRKSRIAAERLGEFLGNCRV